MQKYIKLYFKAFGYDIGDYVSSEISESPAVDFNHIHRRGMGGSKEADRIENIIALTREEHIEYGDYTQHKAMLYIKHRDFMRQYGVKFDEKWIDEQIMKYS